MKEVDFFIKVTDGKYSYIMYKDGTSEAKRHGETWRDCAGDGFILALAQEVNSMRDAYIGARQDLEIWKARALVAEKMESYHDKVERVIGPH